MENVMKSGKDVKENVWGRKKDNCRAKNIWLHLQKAYVKQLYFSMLHD